MLQNTTLILLSIFFITQRRLPAHLKVKEFKVFNFIDNSLWITGRIISPCTLLPCTERATRGGDAHILIPSLKALVINEGQQSIIFSGLIYC